MNYLSDVNEIKHLVCLKCGWGLPLIPRDKFMDFELEFRKQHKAHPLTVLTTQELDDLAEKRAELRNYSNSADRWAKVNKEWIT